MKDNKNIRKYTNAQNGKPKRVKTITDDYGNRVHISKNKTINAGGLSGAKHRLRKQREKAVSRIADTSQISKDLHSNLKKQSKPYVKAVNQAKAWQKAGTGKKALIHKVKTLRASGMAREAGASMKGVTVMSNTRSTKILKRLRKK